MTATEGEVIAQLPSEVTFGEKQYPIKPLKIIKAQAWRKEFGPRLAKVMAASGQKANSMETFLVAFVDSAELMSDAVFGYMPDLPRDEIMENGTEREMMAALSVVMGYAFGPFLGGNDVSGGVQGTTRADARCSIGAIFELMLAEYGLTPEYILNNWTEDELVLILDKRQERIQASIEQMREASAPKARRVAASDLFSTFGSGIRKVK